MNVIFSFMIARNAVQVTSEILGFIVGVNKFKQTWHVLGTLAPAWPSSLRPGATIENFGSSICIEGSRMADRKAERSLHSLRSNSFATCDNEDIASHAEVMKLVFPSWQDVMLTEKRIRELDHNLPTFNEKNAWRPDNDKRGNLSQRGAGRGVWYKL